MATNKSKQVKKNLSACVAHISSTFNNTIISITDSSGNVIAWASTGMLGFKGTKKGTPFAAQQAADTVAEKAKGLGVSEVDVIVKGPGSGRETAIRAIQSAGINIKSINDKTPIPHNGCRPKKRRRV